MRGRLVGGEEEVVAVTEIRPIRSLKSRPIDFVLAIVAETTKMFFSQFPLMIYRLFYLFQHIFLDYKMCLIAYSL
jgi:hypothetical protein